MLVQNLIDVLEQSLIDILVQNLIDILDLALNPIIISEHNLTDVISNLQVLSPWFALQLKNCQIALGVNQSHLYMDISDVLWKIHIPAGCSWFGPY